MTAKNNSEKNMIRCKNTNLSYYTLRKIIGYLGLFLPFTVWIVAWEFKDSISDYYYTRSGVIFTSVLTLVSAFLISYRGYELDKKKNEKISDNIITWIAGLLLLVVVAIPTPFEDTCANCPTPICNCSEGWGWVHFGCAAAFFVLMGYLSIFHFTRRNPEEPLSDDKKIRNRIYRVCGIAMWVILLFAGIMLLCCKDNLYDHFIFWIEVALLVFFGISWLIKGRALVDLGFKLDD